MKKLNAVLEFIIVGTVGTLWHFVYDWTGDNHFIGFFFPVNESTWEHLKLIFFPAIIYSVIEYLIIKNPELYSRGCYGHFRRYAFNSYVLLHLYRNYRL